MGVRQKDVQSIMNTVSLDCKIMLNVTHTILQVKSFLFAIVTLNPERLSHLLEEALLEMQLLNDLEMITPTSKL